MARNNAWLSIKSGTSRLIISYSLGHSLGNRRALGFLFALGRKRLAGVIFADLGVTLLAVSEDLRPLVKWIVWQPQSDSKKYGAVVSLCNQECSHSPL